MRKHEKHQFSKIQKSESETYCTPGVVGDDPLPSQSLSATSKVVVLTVSTVATLLVRPTIPLVVAYWHMRIWQRIGVKLPGHMYLGHTTHRNL